MTPIGIRGATDVPPEPALLGVADEFREDPTGAPGAELDAACPIGGVATVHGRADREVLDAVTIEVPGSDDHSPEHLAGLGSGPVAQLFAAAAGVDEQLTRERPLLILGRGCRDGDVCLAVAVEVSDRRHHAAKAAPGIHTRTLPVLECAAGRG